jgi:hypothetical protein
MLPAPPRSDADSYAEGMAGSRRLSDAAKGGAATLCNGTQTRRILRLLGLARGGRRRKVRNDASALQGWHESWHKRALKRQTPRSYGAQAVRLSGVRLKQDLVWKRISELHARRFRS